MVKPGGTGRPRLAISAKLAPLPPSRSRRPALPSALPSPKVNTHLPDFTASAAGLAATTLPTAFGAGLAGLFFSAVREKAGGAAFARTGAEGFDFAAIFLGLAAALAMADRQSEGEQGIARLTPFWARPRKGWILSRYMWSQRSRPRPIRPLTIRNIATIRLRSRGMIRISKPAMTEMIG